MNVIKIIRDEDFGLDNPAPKNYKEREASRSIVFEKWGNGRNGVTEMGSATILYNFFFFTTIPINCKMFPKMHVIVLYHF